MQSAGPCEAYSRVEDILQVSRDKCQQIVVAESARMDTLRGRSAQTSLASEAGSFFLHVLHSLWSVPPSIACNNIARECLQSIQKSYFKVCCSM